MTKSPSSPIPPDPLTEFSFGPFRLQRDGTLMRNAEIVALSPKELILLRELLRDAGQVVSSSRLREAAWGTVHVSADSLPRCICSLRNHLRLANCIATIYKRGYRLTVPVEWHGPAHARQAAEPHPPLTHWPQPLPLLAILPFVASPGLPSALGQGIAEEVIFQMCRLRPLVARILARDSVFQLDAQGFSAIEVGRHLSAELVITGTLLARPTSYRLRLEMIRIRDEVQLWSEDFLVPREAIATIDQQLTKRVIVHLTNSLPSAAAPPLRLKLPQHPGRIRQLAAQADVAEAPDSALDHDAYVLWLRARSQWNTLERHQTQDAIQTLQRVIELEPSLVVARIHLVHSYQQQSFQGYIRPEAAAALAREQAEEIGNYTGASHSVQAALGWIALHHDRNFAAASVAFRMLDAIDYDSWTIPYRVRFALATGQFCNAQGLLEDAIGRDPYAPSHHGQLTWTLHLLGDGDGARRQAEKSLQLFPEHPMVLLFGAMVLAADSRGLDSQREAALEASRLLTRKAPYFDAAHAVEAFVLARCGQTRQARLILERQMWLARERYVQRSFHVPALVALGDDQSALEELSAAEVSRCPWFFELLADSRLAPLHDAPEFLRLRTLHARMLA